MRKLLFVKLMLKDKKVLLFVPGGQGIYGTEIKKKIENQGAFIKVYNERPSSSVIGKIFTRVSKNISDIPFNTYINKIIHKNRNIKFDYLLVIRAESFHPSSIKLLRHAFPNAKFILYLWDSINNTDTQKIIPYFDKAFSYDPFDVSNNSLLQYRPTFYLDQYRNITQNNFNNLSDIFFIGTIHSDRYMILQSINKSLFENGMSMYTYMFFPGKIMFYKKYLFDSKFRPKNITEFNFIILDLEQTLHIVSTHRASLDIQHPVQTGLTLRPIEMLGARRKLITTNKNIKNYDFYDENNILIIDRNSPVIDKEFLYTPYNPVKSYIYSKYSLQSWVYDIFS